MSDSESIVCLSESDHNSYIDDDDVRVIPKDDDYVDEEEEEKVSIKDVELIEKRGADEVGIILQEESFVETKINQEGFCEPVKQDMTTQTEDFPQNESQKKDSLSTIQPNSSGNRNVTSTVSDTGTTAVNNREKETESKSTTDNERNRNNSVSSYCNSGQYQNNSKVNSGSFTRHNVQKPWMQQTRMSGNRVQPYNRPKVGGQPINGQQNHPNPNFANNYNYFGVPSINYNNFARQNLSVRERYIEQFKEYLCTSFGHFLNNTLPFTLPQGYNNNFPQGSNNNYPQGSNNNFPQGVNNFPQGNNNFPQGNNNFPQGSNNFPQAINSFPQGINSFPQGINNYPQGNNFHRNI